MSLNKARNKLFGVFFNIVFNLCFIKSVFVFLQDENRTLVDRLMKYKSKDVEKMNDENESFLR